MDEFTRELEAPPAVKWKHEPNPLIGKLTSRYTFHGDYEPAEMLIIEPEGSEVPYSVLCGRAVLRSFVERKDPQVGGKVGIKYRGEVESKQTGATYADYATAYEEPRTAFERNLKGGEDTEVPPF